MYSRTTGRSTIVGGTPRDEERNHIIDRIGLPDDPLRRWSARYLESLQPYKNPRAPLQLQQMMTEAGFVEVESRLLTLPLNGWPGGMIKPRVTNIQRGSCC